MMILQQLNLGLAFILELAMLAAWGYWGYSLGSNTFLRILLALLFPILAAGVWGVLLAPNAANRLTLVPRLALEAVLFAGASLALASASQRLPAGLLFGLFLLNKILLIVWKQE